ncbi:MAG: hypothetical protein F6K40_32560 [Okeania sp. SIO3I5]|uniref:hypothetical protein n=1 Tax=Okeania sp. SIO3I5 TaxID=2607805 RepID=UPI0013B65DF7|nr:hypothetical protein [Okeania sp. SIO3I5]NEQ40703.1 hypothetical protein [Okeania sp. SIO3I5]
MNISELNHLENVSESNVVEGGLVFSAGGLASASGISANAGTVSSVSIVDGNNYGYFFYGFNSESGSATSVASASALFGSASAVSSVSGSTLY